MFKIKEQEAEDEGEIKVRWHVHDIKKTSDGYWRIYASFPSGLGGRKTRTFVGSEATWLQNFADNSDFVSLSVARKLCAVVRLYGDRAIHTGTTAAA